MTSRTFTFPSSNFIGFEHLWDEIDKLSRHSDNSYPKHNVIKHNDREYSIELALAGYNNDTVEVEVKEGLLIVRGEVGEDQREYVFKGISSKRFNRTFRLSEHVVVDGANFVDGLLVIDLRVEVPEEKRPRLIPIGKNKPELLVEGNINEQIT